VSDSETVEEAVACTRFLLIGHASRMLLPQATAERMIIDREKILSELESHINRRVQVMRQAATADHRALRNNAKICLESLETVLRLLRRLFEELGLVEGGGS
jgi:hypothetical protein